MQVSKTIQIFVWHSHVKASRTRTGSSRFSCLLYQFWFWSFWLLFVSFGTPEGKEAEVFPLFHSLLFFYWFCIFTTGLVVVIESIWKDLKLNDFRDDTLLFHENTFLLMHFCLLQLWWFGKYILSYGDDHQRRITEAKELRVHLLWASDYYWQLQFHHWTRRIWKCPSRHSGRRHSSCCQAALAIINARPQGISSWG